MRKGIVSLFLLVFIFSMSSFGMHKFYMAIYQINYAPEKKMLQITARIFVEDINKALEKKYNKKAFLGSGKESIESEELLKKYLAEKFSIKVNGQYKAINLLSEEMDGDVLVCYLKINDITKIKSLEIYNSVLVECFAEQQNIVNVSAFNIKKSFLFTETSTKQVLNY
jgi:plasmid maintenance system killer protein